MKTFAVVGSVLGALAGLILVGSSSAYAAGPKTHVSRAIPPGTYDIVFDGYCDGLHISIPGSAGAPGVEAVRTGSCESGDTAYGAVAGGGIGLAFPAVVLFYVIRSNHTWANYADCGTGSECLLHSGTWSFGVPAAPHADLPSSSERGLFAAGRTASAAPAPRVPFSVDISFDGYCDGLHLNLPGSAGNPGVDGLQTGCASAPLIGAKRNNQRVIAWDYGGDNLYVISADHTWILYTICGGTQECFGNSGTWSFGVAAPQENRTTISSSLHR
ncbi:MAG: hypothetical protein L0I62_03195 [Gammaproteobacteria bacterium]|nr:hypothetical protein [Gammaproteobacteria bacterium]